MKKPFLILTLITISMVLSSSCKKDSIDRVPNVAVDVDLFLNLPSNQALNNVGGWQYITGGSRGILIYRNGPEEFIAMDRHCPYEVQNNDRVYVNDTNIIAEDSLDCGSQFVMTDGSVTRGPAQFPLTRYQTSFNGSTNKLRIFN